MRKLCTLACASLLILGFGSAASAAQVDVTYGFGAGSQFSINGQTDPTVAGQYTVRFADGSTTLNGTLQSGAATLLSLQLTGLGNSLPTILGNPVPGMAIVGPQAGGATAGGAANFTNMNWTIIQPPPPVAVVLSWVGSFAQSPTTIPGVMGFGGGGNFTIDLLGSAVLFPWTVSGGGQELARAAVPEPMTGMLLLGGLGGLAAFGARRMRR
jgi:hypothetical protein